MDEETLLEHFEAWHLDEYGWLDMKSRICAERWAGFKAHAECCPVVVELPADDAMGACPNTSPAFDEGYGVAIKHCRTAIEAAGGRVAQ